MKQYATALLLILAVACAPSPPPGERAALAAVLPQSVDLPASKGRVVNLTIWRAAQPKGVVIFGHGLGGEPRAYAAVIDRIVARGYSVVAPLSVDSQAYANRASFDQRSGFAARVEDLMIARGYVHQAFAGQPVALAGHSYGSLFALIGAGAVTPAGPLKGPPVAAVLAFSSPGAIPQLVTASTYAGVTAPLMMVTGDKDVVPGFVPDARTHRLPFDTSPAGSKYLVTVRDGGHDVAVAADGPAFAEIAALSLDFLDAHVAGDAAARSRLAARTATPLLTLERR